jgi:hypothetical protein
LGVQERALLMSADSDGSQAPFGAPNQVGVGAAMASLTAHSPPTHRPLIARSCVALRFDTSFDTTPRRPALTLSPSDGGGLPDRAPAHGLDRLGLGERRPQLAGQQHLLPPGAWCERLGSLTAHSLSSIFHLQAGTPTGVCVEESPGVFSRQWTAGKAALDCHSYTAALPFPSLHPLNVSATYIASGASGHRRSR